MKNKLILNNNFTQGLKKIFQNISRVLNKEDNKKYLKNNEYHFYLFGGLAINLFTGERPSYDVDLECSPELYNYLANEDPNNINANIIVNGGNKQIEFDFNYNSSLGLLHEDYVDNLIEIPFDSNSDNLKVSQDINVKFFTLSPVDLSISKIARFDIKDKEDIIELYKKDLFTIDELEKRTNEALVYYVGNPQFIKINLKEIIEELKKINLNNKIDKNLNPNFRFKNDFVKD